MERRVETVAVFDCLDASNKNGRPKITSTENILGSIQSREVAFVGSTLIVIKDFFSLIMREATT